MTKTVMGSIKGRVEDVLVLFLVTWCLRYSLNIYCYMYMMVL